MTSACRFRFGRSARFPGAVVRLPALLIAAALVAPAARAELLAIRTYTTTDGLPRNQINRIVRDRGGFLWFLTSDGPSRFDGYGFLNLGEDAGLKSRTAYDLLQDRSGTIWVTNRKGLQRMRPGRPPGGEPAFESCDGEGAKAGRRLGMLYESATGALWVGTERGLYEIESSPEQCRIRETPVLRTESPVNGVVEDRAGRVWVACTRSLQVRGTDGRWMEFATRAWPNPNDFRDVVVDRSGTIWAVDYGDILRLVRDPAPGRPIVDRAWTRADGLGEGGISDLLAARDGSIWAGYGGGGVSLLVPESEGRPWSLRTWTDHNGLSDNQVMALEEDLEGNLWMGTEGGGAMRLARRGLTTFGEADGMIDARTQAISEMTDGRLYTISAIGNRYVNIFDGERFRSVRTYLPPSIEYPGWGWGQITFQDREGEWWIATGSGVVRFPRLASPLELATAKPKAVYGEREGLVIRDVFRLYEDRAGDVWISALGQKSNCLYRWERATDRVHGCGELEGMPVEAVTAFAEDSGGTLWLGLYINGLGRLRNGRFQRFTEAEGGVEDFVYSLFIDSRGRLWAATARHGVLRIDDPTAERPVITRLGTAEGLSSDSAHCITEDRFGRIYVGTGQGVDRLGAEGGVERRFTVADGLAGSEVIVAHRDRAGDLWFGSTRGLSRLRPGPDPPVNPPPVWIRGVMIGGVPSELPLLGQELVEGLEVLSSDRRVDIGFSGLELRGGRATSVPVPSRGGGERMERPIARARRPFREPGAGPLPVRRARRDLRRKRKPRARRRLVQGVPTLLAARLVPRDRGARARRGDRPRAPGEGAAPRRARAPEDPHRDGPSRRRWLRAREHRRSRRRVGRGGARRGEAAEPLARDRRDRAAARRRDGGHRLVAPLGVGDPRSSRGPPRRAREPPVRLRRARARRGLPRSLARRSPHARRPEERPADRSGSDAQRGAPLGGAAGGARHPARGRLLAPDRRRRWTRDAGRGAERGDRRTRHDEHEAKSGGDRRGAGIHRRRS